MSIINKGTSFANGEQLTADKINDLIDLATFNQDATDSQTTDVNSAGQIVVNQGGIDTAQLATGAVTKSKIENVADMKALGNTSGSASEPREVAILDENDMSSDSATSLATQQSIKAYIDSMRPKVVTLTGGTLDLQLVNQPNGRINVYNIADFTSDDVDFETYKIIGLLCEGYVGSTDAALLVYASLGQAQNSGLTSPECVIARVQATSGSDSVTDTATTQIPINQNQTDFSFRYLKGNTAYGTFNYSFIRGAIIVPGITDPSI
tara:strand:+ start:749 stop:1543 length:795 start_codon:yes stop_codon:yes gene_type:complete